LIGIINLEEERLTSIEVEETFISVLKVGDIKSEEEIKTDWLV